MDKLYIKGYKIFNSDFTNRYGKVFKEGIIYKSNGNISFGTVGHGIHMCVHLEDVFRYIDTQNGFQVAEVIGFGKKDLYNDEYYGYYDMYSCEKIYITRFLSRKEVINIILESSQDSIIKFLKTCILTNKEKNLFLTKYKENIEIQKHILYYQYNDKNSFNEKNHDIKKLVIKNKS